MKRFSILMLSVLCIAALGFGGYMVYANLSVSMNLHNNVIFDAGDDVYFVASVSVSYAGEQNVIVSDVLLQNGSPSSEAANKTKIEFGNLVAFTRDKDTLVYKITIQNFTEAPIKVSLTLPQTNQYVSNTLDKTEMTLEKQEYTNDGFGNNIVVRDEQTITMTSVRLSAQHSFQLDNTFTIHLQNMGN